MIENTYEAFFRKQRKTITAETSYEAQQKAAKEFKAKKPYEVVVVLAKIGDEIVVHSPSM
jgi:hypothetical protein